LLDIFLTSFPHLDYICPLYFIFAFFPLFQYVKIYLLFESQSPGKKRFYRQNVPKKPKLFGPWRTPPKCNFGLCRFSQLSSLSRPAGLRKNYLKIITYLHLQPLKPHIFQALKEAILVSFAKKFKSLLKTMKAILLPPET
jgi:hypothetical protein